MTTYNTGNPVPSSDAKDLYDNAQNLDSAVNSEALTFDDRLGNTRSTWAGVEQRGLYWIGPSATEPTTRLNGDTLVVGDRYINTGDSLEYYWDGAQWLVNVVAELRDDLSNTSDPALGSRLVGWLLNATGAVGRWLSDKLAERVSIFDFMTAEEIADYQNVGSGTLDHTAPMLAAIAHLQTKSGGILHLPAGLLRATRLPVVSNVTWRGEYGATYIQCIDSTTLDSGVAHGSFIRKADDGTRVLRAGFENLYITTAISGVAASEDVFSAVMGLNLCACERTTLRNLYISGFGMGGIVHARAEAGAEGLGFVNTTQDGNYNVGENIGFGACGKYNADQASLWFKYKGNSNKYYGVFGKAIQTLVTFRFSNDNLISGATCESAKTISEFRQLAGGNTVQSARAEGLSSHAYDYDSDTISNYVFGGYYTGVAGNHANNIENTVGNYVIDSQMNWQGAGNFPPASSASTTHDQRVLTPRAINGDNNLPLHIKSKDYSTGTYPVVRLWNSNIAVSSSQVLGRLDCENKDSTTGAAGVSAAVTFVAESSSGDTAISFETGTGTTRSEKIRIRSNGSLMFGAGISNPAIFAGSGSPEGVVTARVGSIYMRSDGAAGLSFYVKESGTGNTGWVAK